MVFILPIGVFLLSLRQNIAIMSAIIGRKQEIDELERLYDSDRAEFVAVYGRRRVGKTFLIKQALKDKFTFQHTGVSPVDQQDEKNRMKTQLESFFYSMLNQGLEGFKQPKTWMEAFYQLTQLLQKLSKAGRKPLRGVSIQGSSSMKMTMRWPSSSFCSNCVNWKKASIHVFGCLKPSRP